MGSFTLSQEWMGDRVEKRVEREEEREWEQGYLRKLRKDCIKKFLIKKGENKKERRRSGRRGRRKSKPLNGEPEQQLPPKAYYFFTVEEYIPLIRAVYTCNLVTAYGS